MSTKEYAPKGANVNDPYFKLGSASDTKWMDPTGQYGQAMKTNQDDYSKYMAASVANMNVAQQYANQQTPYAMANYNPVAYKSQQAYNPYDYSKAGEFQTQDAYKAIGYNPNASQENFFGNADRYSQLVSGSQSALNQNLNQIAAQQARLGGEAALGSMPGMRNSGAAMAAYGQAYAQPFAQAQAQMQQNQLNLTGNLWGQAQQNAVSENQYGAGLGAQQAMYGYGQAGQQNQNVAAYNLQRANLAAQEGQFGYSNALQNAQFAAQFGDQQSQYGANLAAQQNQYVAQLRNSEIERQANMALNNAQLFGGYGQQNLANYSNLAAQMGYVYQPSYVANPYYGMPNQGGNSQAAAYSGYDGYSNKADKHIKRGSAAADAR